MTTIITVSNNKGGVGKTTICSHFATVEAEKGSKVLIVDLDNQSNIFTTFGLNSDEFEKNVYHMLVEGEKPENVLVKVHPNIDVLPSGDEMQTFELDVILNKDLRKDLDFLLRNAILSSENLDITAYDYVFIDVPPSLSVTIVNALSVSDFVVVPTQLEPYSTRSVQKTFESIRKVNKRMELDLSQVFVPSIVDGTSVQNEILQELRKICDDLEIPITDNVLKKATSIPKHIRDKGQPIIWSKLKAHRDVIENFKETWEEVKQYEQSYARS